MVGNRLWEKVFVYGTLKPGEINYWVCAKSVVEAYPAIAYGQLYALPLGYPAMTSGNTPVHGFILSLKDSDALNTLDQFEQHDPEMLKRYASGQLPEQNQYERKLIEVFCPKQDSVTLAWAYLMTLEQVQRLDGVLLPDGCWTSKNICRCSPKARQAADATSN